MNWDLDTPEGMENAVSWFSSFVEYLNQGGVWAIPRSMSTYQIDHGHKAIHLTSGKGDPSTEKVAKAAGWDVFHVA